MLISKWENPIQRFRFEIKSYTFCSFFPCVPSCFFVLLHARIGFSLAARYSREILFDFYVGFGPGQRVLKTSVVCCCCRRFASSTNKIDPIKCETIGNCIIHVEFSQYFFRLLCSFERRWGWCCCQTVVIARLFVARSLHRLRATGYGYISTTASAGDGLHVYRTAYVFEAQLQ